MSLLDKSLINNLTLPVDYQYYTHAFGYNRQTITNQKNNEIQSLLENTKCSLIIPNDYKINAASYAVNGLVGNNLTADIDLYAAIERKDWNEVSRIYQTVFRPHLKKFAEETILKALAKQAA
ncbi:hypothetical protein [Entomomonas asaccharolytica]|uniref:Uncharacterized protein n=1 Tax=Entomomonas asaccharolytica TaxID=2785331 RepID=A0A974NED3_9GAMM|nr:hypothetical protein [Entomomonas asaccharolytica]QQP85096.1 hypothetical protein JHT90_11980 [Entomomonas asaccharolytica]